MKEFYHLYADVEGKRLWCNQMAQYGERYSSTIYLGWEEDAETPVNFTTEKQAWFFWNQWLKTGGQYIDQSKCKPGVVKGKSAWRKALEKERAADQGATSGSKG